MLCLLNIPQFISVCTFRQLSKILTACYGLHSTLPYLPLVAPRGDASGGQAIAFTPTAMRQPLAIFHHTTLSLLWVEGHFLDGKVLVLLLCLSLWVKDTVSHSNRSW